MELEAMLDTILGLDWVKKEIKERKEMFPEDDLTRLDYILTDFFDMDYEDIFKQMPEIWEWLKEKIREQVDWVTTGAKSFVEEGQWFKMEDFASNELHSLAKDLWATVKKRYKQPQGVHPALQPVTDLGESDAEN